MNKDSRIIFEKYVHNILDESLASGRMTTEELKNYLLTIKGTTPVSVVVHAPVKLLKKSRITGEPTPFSDITKISTINGMGGGDYEIGVMNREYAAHQEDPDYNATFNTEPLWNGKGTRISSLLAQHNITGDYYLVIGAVKSGKSVYIANGQELEKNDIAEYMPKPSDISMKQSAVGISPENQLKVRYPKLNNIKTIHIKNVDIQII